MYHAKMRAQINDFVYARDAVGNQRAAECLNKLTSSRLSELRSLVASRYRFHTAACSTIHHFIEQNLCSCDKNGIASSVKYL